MGLEYLTEDKTIVKKYIKRIKYKCDACGKTIAEAESIEPWDVTPRSDEAIIYKEISCESENINSKLPKYKVICHDNLECFQHALSTITDMTLDKVDASYTIKISNRIVPNYIIERELTEEELEEINNGN